MNVSLLSAIRDFRRTWPQLVLTDLAARAIGVAVTVPLVGMLLKLFLLAADDGVLTDTDIAAFALHPIGLFGVVVVGCVVLGLLFVETALLMVIAFGAAEDRVVTWLDALRYVVRYAPRMIGLARRVLVRLLLLAAPFLAGAGAVYVFMLGAHDINYYLADRPPEFLRAIAIAGVLAVALLAVVIKQIADWILALPMVLFEQRRAKEALAASRQVTRPRSVRIALWVAAWLAAPSAITALFSMAIHWLGVLLVPPLVAGITRVAVGVAITLLVQFVVSLVVTIVTTAMFPLLVVGLYRSTNRGGALRPPIAEPGTLGDRAEWRVPGTPVLWAVAAAAALALGIGFVASRSAAAEESVEIIAHRGASGAAPDNTMASFRAAVEQGADWIELDVQEDADGTVIVVHDSDFMKVAGTGLKVWDATADDLRDLDVGSWFAPRFSDQRVPTLREVLEFARGKIGVVIELKYYGHDDMLEQRVVDIVEQTGMVGQIQLMSLKRDGLRKAMALRPNWPRGLLNTAAVGDLTRLDLDFLALNASAAKSALIRRAQDRGRVVYAWTINDPVRMSVMMSRGVNGVITNEPAVARQVLAYRATLGPLGRIVVWIAGETGLLRTSEQPSTEEDA